MLIRVIETAIVCLTECDEARGDRMPYIWYDPTESDWHGWDHHIGQPEKELKIIRSPALDERYYGDLQGLNKAEMAEKFGEKQVHLWRRSYDVDHQVARVWPIRSSGRCLFLARYSARTPGRKKRAGGSARQFSAIDSIWLSIAWAKMR